MIRFLNNILKERLRKKKYDVVKLRWQKDKLEKMLFKIKNEKVDQ